MESPLGARMRDRRRPGWRAGSVTGCGSTLALTTARLIAPPLGRHNGPEPRNFTSITRRLQPDAGPSARRRSGARWIGQPSMSSAREDINDDSTGLIPAEASEFAG